MYRTPILAAVCLAAVLLVTACQLNRPASAEEAARTQIARSTAAGVVIDPESIQFLQQQKIESRTYVLLSYQRVWDQRDESCITIVETHFEWLPAASWKAGNRSAICRELPEPDAVREEPMQSAGGTFHLSERPSESITFFYGSVFDPAIVRVSATWKDGQTQEIPVEQGSYLALRTGAAELKFAAGLNEEGEVVYSIQY